MERPAPVEALQSKPKPRVSSTVGSQPGELGLETEIVKQATPPRAVHKSKLRKKESSDISQDEFLFVEANTQRGYFEKTDQNLYKDEDLDVPTFMRRGIKIKIKV